MSFQTSAPVKGDKVAVMHTNMGDIKIKLFVNEVPRTAQNLKQKMRCNFMPSFSSVEAKVYF